MEPHHTFSANEHPGTNQTLGIELFKVATTHFEHQQASWY
ncbi:hypothetical protein M23134_07296 [Microscilla marina ATCC 23134]|uniref:Uncharacterized protein n=1 Tax=Microscilla marina ATCC 23134 TaxID=313606 RepID=A1ZVE7_MICM2|nr:hypothetical protein M23134_07296 [Microscilla marina ATCC 23134]